MDIFKRTVITIVSLLIFTNLSAQFKVQGIVYDNEGIPMPGVNVIEAGTNPSIATDADGKFSIICKDENAIINFSFIGFLSQHVEVSGRDFLTVHLQLDSVQLSEKIFWCVSYDRNSRVGLSSGLNYAHLGFLIKNFTPYLFGLNSMLGSGFEWRVDNSGNRYVNLFLKRYGILTIKSASIGIYGEFERADYNHTEVTDFFIAPDITYRGFIFSLGYAHQSIFNDEANLKSSGLYFGLSKYLFGQLEIAFTSQFVNDLFQYEVQMSEAIPGTRINVGIGYQKLYTFNEVSGSIAYRLSY